MTTEADVAQLELDLENKSQDDDCIKTFVPALQDALKDRRYLIAPLRLEELSLRNNSITAVSLSHLTSIIGAARYDLRDVDISQNKIGIQTKEDADAFARFLRAFSGCERMRRLDLSGNDFSGPLAMETMLKVYSQQPAVKFALSSYHHDPERNDSSYDMLSDVTNGLDLNQRDEASDDGALRRGTGLRAIPYIILKDSGIDDAGALHLSYILEQHHLPQYLMTKLKEGSKEAKRKEEDDAGGCFGLVVSHNSSLSSYGEKLLEYANTARADLTSREVGERVRQESSSAPIHATTPSSLRSRKMSFQSDGSGEQRKNGYTNNILSLRKRLQRMTIERHGIRGVKLWHAALKVLYAARVLIPPHKSENASDSPKISTNNVLDDGPSNAKPKHVPDMPINKRAPENSPLAITSDANHSLCPAIGDSECAPDESSPTRTTSSREQPDRTTNKSFEVHTPMSVVKPFDRHISNPKDLPTKLLVRMVVESAGAHDILSDRQVEVIVEYARDRSNLADERHNQAKGESQQVWHVLEQLDCLTYEME